MGAGGYKIRNQSAVHFITFAVVERVDRAAPLGLIVSRRLTITLESCKRFIGLED